MQNNKKDDVPFFWHDEQISYYLSEDQYQTMCANSPLSISSTARCANKHQMKPRRWTFLSAHLCTDPTSFTKSNYPPMRIIPSLDKSLADQKKTIRFQSNQRIHQPPRRRQLVVVNERSSFSDECEASNRRMGGTLSGGRN